MKKYLFFAITAAVLFISTAANAAQKKITIVHTNDMHSHLLGFSPNIDYTPETTGDDKTAGGWARIATVTRNVIKDRDNAVIVLDGGDFLMGSMFHMISREKAAELGLMYKIGYDAAVLGNHEFDLKPEGLARIINSAHKRGAMPDLLLANIRFSDREGDDTLEEVFNSGLVKPWTVIERDGLRIGLFGIIGKTAAEVAPFASPVTFTDPVETAREMVTILRKKEKVDMVICLSHSGLWEDKSKSEDEILAREVPGIDVIISGHTHTKLESPIVIRDTVIVQGWSYGRRVGVLDCSVTGTGLKVDNYRSVAVDDSIPGDPDITGMINDYVKTINRSVLAEHGLTFNTIIAETDFDLVIEEAESNLGNLISDAMVWYVNRHDSDPADPGSRVSVAIESYGLIRDPVLKGETGRLAVCDIFRAFPLGIGSDGTMAYPLVSVYLTGAEIKKALEILTSVHPLKGPDYYLQISGLKFSYNPNRVIFDRVMEIRIGNQEEGYVPLDYSSSNTKLYRVVANIYNSTFLKLIGGFTMGILEIVPKDRQGRPITKLDNARVDIDPGRQGVQEAKEWIAIMEYFRTFRDSNGNGIPDVPDRYSGREGRIVKTSSWNPVNILAGGNRVTWIVFSVIVIVLAVFSVIGRWVYSQFVK